MRPTLRTAAVAPLPVRRTVSPTLKAPPGHAETLGSPEITPPMPNLLAMFQSIGCVRGRLARPARASVVAAEAQGAPGEPGSARSARSALAAAGASESGVTLVEVIISALLVGLIVVGTLTGFDSAGRAAADGRAHNQATLLAGQDEERLRGLNAAELANLGQASRTVTENGTTFTITSSRQYVSASKETLTCETTEGTADYIQTTSKVTWPSLGSREPVSQSSILAVPSSLSLLVKVFNQNHEHVEGALVNVMNSAGTSSLAEQTTPAAGCVIFGALPEKKVDVTALVPNYINEAGETTPPAKELTLSASALTSAEFVIAAPGSIMAEFESNGSSAGVTGDTFFATHSGVARLLVGGTAGSYGSSATLTGLFPFVTVGTPPTANPYTVYAGDCAANNAEEVANPNPIVSGKKEIIDPPAQVTPNGVTHVKVEVPAVNVIVYEGSAAGASQGALDSKAEAKITNNECSNTVHPVKLTSTGTLEQKYQPYARKLTLCVSQVIGSQRYRYSTEFANTAKAGISLPTIYMTATAHKTSGAGC
jgi:Tfp pilus assembly protein PilV